MHLPLCVIYRASSNFWTAKKIVIIMTSSSLTAIHLQHNYLYSNKNRWFNLEVKLTVKCERFFLPLNFLISSIKTAGTLSLQVPGNLL